MELDFLTQFSETMLKTGAPGWGQFELTPVCNLKCKMCYVHKPEEDAFLKKALLPASFWLGVAKQAVKSGMLVLSLTGGETLLYPEIDELMEGLIKLGLLISFNTNGTLIDEKRVAWFKKYAPTKINISLYGSSDEVYEKVCGIKNGFTKVSDAISRLQKEGLNVYLNGVVVPENKDDLKNMHQYAFSRGLELHTTTYIFPPRGCKSDCSEFHRMNPIEASEMLIYEKKGLLSESEFKKSAASTSLKLFLNEHNEDFQKKFKKCRAGDISFAVNFRGEMQPCVLFDLIKIPVNEDNFNEAWDLLRKRVSEVQAPAKCMSCKKQEVCPVCLAAIYKETGGFLDAPSYLCDYTAHLTDILRWEGRGVEISIPDSGDFGAGGCTE